MTSDPQQPPSAPPHRPSPTDPASTVERSTPENTTPELSTAWPDVRPPVALQAGHVHVWRISLTPHSEAAARSVPDCLDASERQRADRFLADVHRVRFRLGRAAMRRVLGAYLHRSPGELVFRYTGLGKPYLPPSPTMPPLQFNFSNSADWALLAITRDHELGVDLERVRTMSDMEGLARRFFAPQEIDAIMSYPDFAERQRAFFRCWTRKEAFLKAVGKGLTFPLNRVCVSSRVDEPARILWIDDDQQHAASWSLYHLEPVAGYLGAVAVPAPQMVVHTFDYRSSF